MDADMDQENQPMIVKVIKPWRSKEVESLRQELLELEDEVAELEKVTRDETEDRSASLEELQHAMNFLANMPDPEYEDEASLDSEITKLKKELQLMSTVSGVKLHKTTSRIQNIDYTKSIMKSKQIIEGSCCDVDFTAQITIQQSQKLEKKVSKITEFFVDIEDWPVKEQLQPAIVRMQNELEVGRFFEVLPAFMAEFEKRRNMYGLLKKEFSENVRLSDGTDGETISFGDKKMGTIWTIIWTIEVSKDYEVKNAAALEISQTGKPSKKKPRLENDTTPEQFAVLVKKVGVVRGIESFVRQFSSTE